MLIADAHNAHAHGLVSIATISPDKQNRLQTSERKKMAAELRPQYSKLATRYAALTARAKAGDSLVPDTAYADFLRFQSPPSSYKTLANK